MDPKSQFNLIIEVSEATFGLEVLQSSQPVLVAFWAPWSHPCHVLESTLAEVATACVGRVRVARVNADDNPDLGLWYDIQSVPTLIVFVAGMPQAKIVGTATKEAILARLVSSSGIEPLPTEPCQL